MVRFFWMKGRVVLAETANHHALSSKKPCSLVRHRLYRSCGSNLFSSNNQMQKTAALIT